MIVIHMIAMVTRNKMKFCPCHSRANRVKIKIEFEGLKGGFMHLYSLHHHFWFTALMLLLLGIFLLFSSGLGCSANVEIGPPAKTSRR